MLNDLRRSMSGQSMERATGRDHSPKNSLGHALNLGLLSTLQTSCLPEESPEGAEVLCRISSILHARCSTRIVPT